MTQHGGKRSGSGRKKGKDMFDKLSMGKRRKIVLRMIKDKDVEKIVKYLIQRAMKNTSTAKYVINQLIGRPLQATDITSGGEKLESFNDEQVNRIAKRVAEGKSSVGGPPSS